MKLLIVACALLSAAVLSAPQGNPDDAVQIVRYFYDHRGLDGYKFTLVSDN